MNNEKEKYLYIPVEIFRRELKGMLILSLHAVSKGWNVTLGGKYAMFPYLGKLPQGLVLTKSVVPGEYENLKKIKSEGHHIISVDAEGLVLSKGEIGTTLRYSPETIEISDALFFWGQRQFSRAIEIYPQIKDKATVTGSPVFDHWRMKKFQYKKNPSNQSNKKTVLIATGFAYPNHIISEDMAKQLLIDTLKQDTDKEKYLDDFLKEGRLQKIAFPKFKEFVEEIIKTNPEIDFILRPHLAENPKPWIAIGKKFKNVTMSLDGEISPILLGADALVHFNSTTSIEATFFEREIITYIPKADIPKELFDMLNEDALAASTVCYTQEEAQGALDEIQKGHRLENHLKLDELIQDSSSLQIDKCSSNIFDVLKDVDRPITSRTYPQKLPSLPDNKSLIPILKRRAVWLLGWLDHFTGLFKKKYAPYKDLFTYGKTKQGHVDTDEVFNLVDEINEMLDINPEGVNFTELKNGLFYITPKSSPSD